MKVINLVPGSVEWLQSRTASQASIIMGESPYCTRSELLRMKATGGEKAVSEWAQKNLLDKGHEIEARARAAMSDILYEDLYPMCGATDDGYLTASFDGITVDWSTIWECKSWNKKKVADVNNGVVPAQDYWQVVQQAIVSDASAIWYEVSDENGMSARTAVSIPDDDKQRLIAAWKQFDEDLENYQYTEATQAATAQPVEGFGALVLQVEGRVVSCNLVAFQAGAKAFLERLPRAEALVSDQDFADAKAAVKACVEAESRIEATKAAAMAQAATIYEAFRSVDHVSELIRSTRLALGKSVKAREESIRAMVIARAQQELDQHIIRLNNRIGKNWMPRPAPGFADAAKGKSNLQNIQDAVDTTLAFSKIAANEAADKIEMNLKRLRELAEGYETLFADAQLLVMKDAADFEAVVRQRIAEHKEAEEAKRVRAEQNTAQPPSSPPSQGRSLPAPAAVAVPDDGHRLSLGEINGRFGAVLTVTAAGLAHLGVEPVEQKKAGKYYRASDFNTICDALIVHLQKVKT